MLYFQNRIEKEEANLIRQQGVKEADYATQRARQLEELWGPSLTTSVATVGCSIPVAVKFIVQLCAIEEKGATPELATLKKDANADLLSLSDVSGKTNVGVSSPKESPTKGKDEEIESSLSALNHTLESRSLANSVLYQMRCSFIADYLSSVAHHSGDENDGSIAAASVMTDCLQRLAYSGLGLLPKIMMGEWKTKILTGLLNCLLSPHPVVLGSGLQNLTIILTTCINVIGEEVGYLYSDCLYRLLESENCLLYIKREIVFHLLYTFLMRPPLDTAPDGEDLVTSPPPLLLRLYCGYDLNVNSHHLNLGQQFIAVLSRIVRRAHSSEFLMTTAEEAAPANPKEEVNSEKKDPKSLPEILQGKTLPYIALYGLVTAIEMVGHQIPPEDGVEGDPLLSVAQINLRELKLELQRNVDIVNDSPKKGILKIFNVTPEEMDPDDVDERFKKEFDHNFLPPPKTEETRRKVVEVCDFLIETSSLTPEAVAEFITTPSVFPLQVCTEYMSRLKLGGCTVVMALKELLSAVQLPKEGQRIERLLEYFAFAYYKANNVPGVDRTVFPFQNEDTCFVIVVATVMLNTDLHNPVVASRMTQQMFCSQLKGCDKNITTSFSDSVFESISQTPLSNISGRTGGNVLNPAEVRGGLDAFFISYDERRQIAFGMERQRIATETRQLLCLRSCPPHTPPSNDWTWWCGVARDFFLSSWASLCAVFGPAMCEDSSSPKELLQLSIAGLKAVLKIASAYALPTECEISMRSLMYITKFNSVAGKCRVAVLDVASSAYSIHFSTPCWITIIQLIASLNDSNKNAAVEAVYARIEYYTRARCEEDSEAGKSADPARLEEAVKSILEAAVEVVLGSPKNGVNLSTALHLLRRCLGYTVLVNDTVTNCMNAVDFSGIVLPKLVEAVEKFKGSDESLKVVVETVVEVLTVMWTSGMANVRLYNNDSEGVAGKTNDKRLLSFVQSCEFFKMCYTANSQSGSSSTLVKMHLVQGVKEFMTRSLLTVEAAAITAKSLDTIVSSWRRVLYPIVRALSDKDANSSEACSVAVVALRQLVGTACGTGATADKMIPMKVKQTALLLLTNVCYVGVMCGDLESAHTCLGQLPTLCTAALNQEGTVTAASEEKGIPEFKDPSNLVLYLVHCIEHDPQFVAKHILERLCLLLRSEHEPIRSEICESLRSLSMQLQPGHVYYLTTLLSDVALEGTLGWASPHTEIRMSDPTLISFWLFLISLPPTMKRCSRSSFRTVLPSVLAFMTDDLLASAPIAECSVIAEMVMERCLVPIIASPTNGVQQVRSLAARSLTACALFSLKRYSPESNRYPLQALLNGVGLALYSTRIEMGRILPNGTDFMGKDMTEPNCESDAPFVAYEESCKGVLNFLATADPPDISGRETSSSVLLVEEAPVPSLESRKSRTVSSSGTGAAIAKDEELVEYCNTISQLLSGLPKVLCAVNPTATSTTTEVEERMWTLPDVPRSVLVSLLLSVLRTHFGILWRTTHPQEMQGFLSAQSSGDVSSVNHALMPHAAVRGALNSFIELAVQAKDYPFSSLLTVTVGLLHMVGKVQKQVLAADATSARVTTAPEQLLSPQEQQHIRMCYSGMYQELSVVLGHWLKTLQQPPEYANLTEERRKELQSMALDAQLFEAFVNLLTPTAGLLIVAAKDYFSWYIEQKKLSQIDIPPPVDCGAGEGATSAVPGDLR
ncbi:hypothetical protein AGDE_15723 [Angomonas deanei]|uniref:Sec7 domain containing protein, putative n=1 Tax=Angomonas deanei TaxID=59799 RepID=A0A7G2CQY4_9TRYP|nr:hypothetical protein AGDE_15723 [Angomonas deanei]CAD2222170.1 Sec7 domain containing protein, putative [Angomonas deanei]|eukprot:EPY18572.1 hypothetical protein AGDE_15723 [Angomonas deanei]